MKNISLKSALCLFSAAAIVATRPVIGAFTDDTYINAASATDLDLDYVPFTPSTVFSVVQGMNAHLRFDMADPTYATLARAITFQERIYSQPQIATLGLAVDNYFNRNLTDPTVTALLAKFNKLNLKTVINKVAAIAKHAEQLGVPLPSCADAELMCALRKIKNKTATQQFKQQFLKQLVQQLNLNVLTLDHVLMQMGLLQILGPSAMDDIPIIEPGPRAVALLRLTEQVNAIRTYCYSDPQLKAAFVLLFANARAYATEGAILTSAQRITQLLPAIAESIAILRMHDTPVLQQAINAYQDTYEKNEATIIAKYIYFANSGGAMYKNLFCDASRVTGHNMATINDKLALLKDLNIYSLLNQVQLPEAINIGKYADAVKVLLQQYAKNKILIHDLMLLITLSENSVFVAQVREQIERLLVNPQTHAMAEQALKSFYWFLGNKEYVIGALINLKPGASNIAKNNNIIANVLNKLAYGVTHVLENLYNREAVRPKVAAP